MMPRIMAGSAVGSSQGKARLIGVGHRAQHLSAGVVPCEQIAFEQGVSDNRSVAAAEGGGQREHGVFQNWGRAPCRLPLSLLDKCLHTLRIGRSGSRMPVISTNPNSDDVGERLVRVNIPADTFCKSRARASLPWEEARHQAVTMTATIDVQGEAECD